MQSTAATQDNRLTLLAFGGAVVIAGGNIVAVRFTAGEVPPFFGAALRFAIAGLLLVVIALLARLPRPTRHELTGTVLYGLLAFGGAMALGYWALQELPASTGGVIVSSVPVLTLFLARLQHQEPFRVRGLVGGVLTIIGIWILVTGGGSAGAPVASAIAMFAGAVCLAEAGIVVKRFHPAHPVVFNGVAMIVGAVVLTGASVVAGESWVVPDGADVWLALAFMIFAGSMALFALYLFVLQGWTASAASYQFVLIPIVTALLGSVLLDEPLGERFVLGALTVIAGVYVGALSSGAIPLPGTHHQEAHAQRCATT